MYICHGNVLKDVYVISVGPKFIVLICKGNHYPPQN
jgi:hypothetical protein